MSCAMAVPAAALWRRASGNFLFGCHAATMIGSREMAPTHFAMLLLACASACWAIEAQDMQQCAFASSAEENHSCLGAIAAQPSAHPGCLRQGIWADGACMPPAASGSIKHRVPQIAWRVRAAGRCGAGNGPSLASFRFLGDRPVQAASEALAAVDAVVNTCKESAQRVLHGENRGKRAPSADCLLVCKGRKMQ